MNEPLKAGEPLAQARDGSRRRQRKAQAVAQRPRRGRIRRFLRGVAGGVLGVGMLVALLAGAGGYFAWLRFSADLPNVDGLRNYQPPVMSRVLCRRCEADGRTRHRAQNLCALFGRA